MRPNKREAEPDFYDMLVDVKVWSTVSTVERVQPWQCRVTPKFILTPGGARFSRDTGRQLVARKYLYGSTYKRRALVETLRPVR
jgi:hypothetical protein